MFIHISHIYFYLMSLFRLNFSFRNFCVWKTALVEKYVMKNDINRKHFTTSSTYSSMTFFTFQNYFRCAFHAKNLCDVFIQKTRMFFLSICIQNFIHLIQFKIYLHFIRMYICEKIKFRVMMTSEKI